MTTQILDDSINTNSTPFETKAADVMQHGAVSLPVYITASSLHLTGCRHCGAVWEDASAGEACGRCGSALHARKPNSLNRTWALLITACIMYLPANLLPVMTTSTLLGSKNDTILSGVIYFWVSGAYGLAAIIFIASFLLPLFKIAALLILLLLAQRHSSVYRPERARLYHFIEAIGRWSMLDVFVVALLAGLVRIEGFAEIHAGVGIAAFGAVVVLTMLASLSFDPKLIWDDASAVEADQADIEQKTIMAQNLPAKETSHV
jgi:paraquat-inducible protein A